MSKPSVSLVLLLTACFVLADAAQSQNILDRARRAAERGAERAVEREAERRTDRAVTGAIECVVGDRACAEQAAAEGRDVQYVDEAGAPVSTAAAPAAGQAASPAGAAAAVPGEGVWANYDFVPGNRPLFIEDFSADRVGNFPRRLTFGEGNVDVVQWEGQTLLRATARSAFSVPLPQNLPERFTIEFDAYSGDSEWIAVMTSVPDQPLGYSQYPGSYLVLTQGGVDLDGAGPKVSSRTNALAQRLTPFRIAVDGSYIKAYADEHRVVNVPNANIVRGDVLHFMVWYAREDRPTYIGNLRVMAGGDDLYDRLRADGRVATQGILFDTGSARIRPESTPTLKDIARTLQQHADLRLRIEGHTDSVGSADANRRLSEQRAQAVVEYLVQRERIAGDRLEALGLGQDQPVADNDSAEGRQTNRRVELVVID